MAANVENLCNEIWKPIVTLHGKYEASTFGRIRNSKTHHIKAIIFDGYYYKFGYDYSVNKIRYRGWYRVHKAIAETFIPNPDNKPTVNHKDGDHSNNCVSNLEWATYKEQMEHATKQLKVHVGDNNYNAKHSNEEVKEIRRLYENGEKTIKELSIIFNDTYENMRRVVKYERWNNI